MEVPVQLAVRIKPSLTTASTSPEEENKNTTTKSVRSIPAPNIGQDGLIQVENHTFPVTYAFPEDITQKEVYLKTVYPLVWLILDGYDLSIIAYGQKRTGKTFTLFGVPANFIGNTYDLSAEGLVQQCARELFHQLSILTTRNYAITIEWTEINGEVVRDLLDSGSVPCYNINDIFYWLRIGFQNKNTPKTPIHSESHTLFTLKLEQQWISKEGLIQHRLATLSFMDLCGTDRTLNENIPSDLGLQSLEKVVNQLTCPVNERPSAIDYNQTTLTTLLKDAFGGRAQTLMILCTSAEQKDLTETISNLQFAYKVRCVKNHVIMNTFSDNNTRYVQLPPPAQQTSPGNFAMGLQFSASPWFKLVSNAEGLFSRLMVTQGVTENEKKQIREWLFLKQECEDCLSSTDMTHPPQNKILLPIKEEETSISKDQDDTEMSDQETSMQQASDENDSDAESPELPDLEDKIDVLMKNLELKTDILASEKCKEFLSKPMSQKEDKNGNMEKAVVKPSGRRRSVQLGTTHLSTDEIAHLNKSHEKAICHEKAISQEKQPLSPKNHSPIDSLQRKLRKVTDDIKSKTLQINKLKETIDLKKELIGNIKKTQNTRTIVENRFKKKKTQLKADLEKAKGYLADAKDNEEVEISKSKIAQLKQRLDILNSIKHLTKSDEKLKEERKHSLSDSEKHHADLNRQLSKSKKLYKELSEELKREIEKNVKLEREKNSDSKSLKKKKALEDKYPGDSEEQKSKRHEIQKLRLFRDYLVEQKIYLDQRVKGVKGSMEREKRKLRECNEGIEAIDAVIEYKNEMICGRKSIDLSSSNKRLQAEKGSQVLVEILSNLSNEEMRMLLYKFFMKIMDLKESSSNLESLLNYVELEKDDLEQKVRYLRNTIQQERLEYDSKMLALKKQHEGNMNLMLQHFAVDTSMSGNSSIDQQRFQLPPSYGNADLDLYNNHFQSRQGTIDLSRRKDREKNKLFSNLNLKLLARYQCSTSGSNRNNENHPILPLDNLRQLMPPPSNVPPMKVTRQRNKIIIEDSSRK